MQCIRATQGIATIDNLEILNDDDYAEFVGKVGKPQEAVENVPHTTKAARALPLPITLGVDDMRELPWVYEDDEFGRIAINFDNFTHDTGEQRAFCYCNFPHPGVPKCRKYKFLKDFASRRECAGWLLAWRMLAADCDDGVNHALDVSPSPAVVQHCMMLLVDPNE